MMKFLNPILFCALISIGSSCKKVDKLTQFYIQYESEVTIPNTSGVNVAFSLITPDVETNSESEFAVHDTRKDKIQQIKLSSMIITIKSPPGQEFDFLKEAEVFISASGLPETMLASKYNIENTIGAVLTMDVSGADFKEYIKKESFTLRLRTITDEALFQDVELNLISTFWVDAKLIGKA